MKILLAGGRSSLACALRPILSSFSEVLTAGRDGCEIAMDLLWPAEQICLPQGIDVVVNTVAFFGGDNFNAMEEAEAVNTLGALKLCQAARKAGARHFVHISSTSAYLDEHSQYYGIYALSKRHADEVARLYCARVNLPCAILRPSQLYGAEYFKKHQPFLYNAVDKALRGENIVIYGSRDALRNYLHAEDFCKIIRAVIEQGVEGIYSCTSAWDDSLLKLAQAAIRAAGSRSQVIFDSAFPDIPDNTFHYDDALYRKIGVYPAIRLEEGIIRLVAGRLSKT
jgi:nucleoside-diphosphate-sugar epimerase